MDRDEWIAFGGILRDNAGAAVDGAWIGLDDPTGTPTHRVETKTADGGRFVFERVLRGTGYTLRAQAVGIGGVTRTIDIPSPTGEYDLTLP